MPYHSSKSRVLLLALLLPMGGCSTLHGVFDPPAEPQTTAANVVREQLQEPISRNFFVLDGPEQSVIGALQIVFTGPEDTFSDLAREYGLGFDELAAANPGIDPWLPGSGTPVLLPTQYVLPAAPRQGLVLNIATMRLFYFPAPEDGAAQTVLTYPIGIGRVGWETPLGQASVIAKARDPAWYVPASVRKEHAEAGDPLPAVVAAGPDNPLGAFVLKLDLPGYLIHGTNHPYGVGMRVSHGCIRLYPENIDTLYGLVDVGTPVVIVNQPYLVGVQNGQLYFESHLPLEDNAVDTAQHIDALAQSLALSGLPGSDEDTLQAGMHTIASAALGVPVLLHKRDAGEIYERARQVRNTVLPDPDAPTLLEVREMLDQPVEPIDTTADALN